MSENFDAYYKWLGIPPEEQPPHHYRLLGIRLFEADADVIDAAADRQMAHLQTFAGRTAVTNRRETTQTRVATGCPNAVKPAKSVSVATRSSNRGSRYSADRRGASRNLRGDCRAELADSAGVFVWQRTSTDRGLGTTTETQHRGSRHATRVRGCVVGISECRTRLRRRRTVRRSRKTLVSSGIARITRGSRSRNTVAASGSDQSGTRARCVRNRHTGTRWNVLHRADKTIRNCHSGRRLCTVSGRKFPAV